MKIKILFTIILLTTQLYALSKHQEYIKTLVYDISKRYTNYPTLMVNICETESSFGRYILGDDRSSLGIFQFRVATVRDMVRLYPKKLSWVNSKSNKEIETILLTSPSISTQLAVLRFEYYRKKFGWWVAVSKHNGGSHNKVYVNRVLSKRGKYIEHCVKR